MREAAPRVGVIGLGYVGLPTAAVIAARGIPVVGVDVDARRVRAINAGAPPTVEPDLQALVRGVVAGGMLRAVPKPVAADAFLIAVPTPYVRGHGPSLDALYAAADSLAPFLRPGSLVILESTSPVGTTENLCARLAGQRADLSFPHTGGARSDVRVAYSSERATPGRMIAELTGNDRVIGGVSETCAVAAAELYRRFVRGRCHLTTARTAELVKLSENAFRDVNIAFANELALVCETVGVDQWELIRLANHHPRVDILRPGPGVGGHCIAVDPHFLVHAARERTSLIQAARRVNDGMPRHVAGQVAAACRGLTRPTLACLGLAYKADVGDLRNSPAMAVIEHVLAAVAGRTLVVEPHLDVLPPALAADGRIALVSLEAALAAADVVLLLTDHAPFRRIDAQRLAGKTIIDTRGSLRARRE